jgi:hypothetical protein
MRNVSNKLCTENQNTNFLFDSLFRKSRPLWDNVEKGKWCSRSHKWYHNMAHTRSTLLSSYTRERPFTRSRTHSRVRTHKQICNTYCFSTAAVVRGYASMLRNTYIACLANWFLLKELFFFLKRLSLDTDSANSNEDQQKLTYFTYFPWPPLEAGLSASRYVPCSRAAFHPWMSEINYPAPSFIKCKFNVYWDSDTETIAD